MSLLARREAILVFLTFAFAYFLSALVRAITATLSPTLTAEFSLHARDLGLLAGGYFLGFSATQLPLGSWLDKHGPRKVILSFLVFAVAGCGAFAVATSFSGLLAARMLCGVGVSACLMAPLTGFRRWLDPATLLRVNSWMLMSGSLGMVAATLPVQWLMPVLGWRPLFWGLALLVLLAMVLIAWHVPAWPRAVPEDGATPASYAVVWRHPYFQRTAPIGFFNYGGMVAVQTLWAGPWLTRVAGVDPLAAAGGLFTINLCMLGTFWLWGLLNPRLARRGLHTDWLITWCLPWSLLMIAIIVIAGKQAGALTLALFCMTSTVVALAQPAVGMAFPARLAGRALSAYNLVVFLGVFAVQWGVGLIVDGLRAAGFAEVDAYRGAMAVFGVACAGSYVWFLLGKSHNQAS